MASVANRIPPGRLLAGPPDVDDELFYTDKTMMIFGDAKMVVEDMVKAVE